MLSTRNSLVMKISWTFFVTTGQNTGIEARIHDSRFSASPRTNIRGNLNVRSLDAPSWFKTWFAARRKPAITLMLMVRVSVSVHHAWTVSRQRGVSTHTIPIPNKARSPILVFRWVSLWKRRGIGRMKIIISSAVLNTLVRTTARYTSLWSVEPYL